MNGAQQRFSTNSVSPELRGALEPVIDAVVRGVAHMPYSEQSVRTICLQLLDWCHREGIPTQVAAAFHPDVIDRFCVKECAHLASGTRLNYQSRLRRIGGQLLGPPLYPAKTASLRASIACAPYSESDIAAMLAMIRGLPTKRMRDEMHVILSFGLGAGITSAELNRVRGIDIESDSEGVVIHVEGRHARTIPVRRRWEAAVHRRARLVGDKLVLLPSRAATTPKDISRLIEACPQCSAPKLSTQRLRASWIVALLQACIPLNEVGEVAGAAPKQIADYARYLPRADAIALQRLLRAA